MTPTRTRWVAGLLGLCAATAPSRAVAAQEPPGQEPAPTEAPDDPRAGAVERLSLRVTGPAGERRVTVDRGTRDGVAEGDRVFLRPRDGGLLPGRVVRVDDRTAEVELQNAVEITPGTRGEVVVPAARLADLEAERARREEALGADEPLPEHPPWANPDDDWNEDMPLLAQVDPIRPEERAVLFSGRAWAIFDGVASSLDDRYDTFGRIGTDVELENGFGRGGVLRLSAEADYRKTFVEDQVDVDDGYQRIERLSYTRGGTRFDRERWEFGRFLLHGMPEFGIVDGVEYSRRLPGGHTVGGSVGWMPEPNAEMESGHDFQVSGYYRWVADESERFSITGGYQKTFHQTTSDRDLLVGKVIYLPAEGWDVHGTVWVDVYDDRDDVKGSGVEVTQAYLSTSKRWAGGQTLDLGYSRIAFPELERRESLTPVNLANQRNDRVSVTGWWPTGRTTRVKTQLGVWQDEDQDGGDAEVGIEGDGLLSLSGRTGLALVATEGEFTKVLAARVTYSDELVTGRWGLLYQAAHAHQQGFNAANDEFYNHWLRGSRDWHLSGGWDLAVHVDARSWEEDHSIGLGIYLQRRFY